MHSAFFLLSFPPLKNRASLIGPICHTPVNRFVRLGPPVISCSDPHFSTGWHVRLPASRSKALISHDKSVDKGIPASKPLWRAGSRLKTSRKPSHKSEGSQLIRRAWPNVNSPGIIDLEVSNGNNRSLSCNPREFPQYRGEHKTAFF